MRKIKFRGKRVDNGEWVEGYYAKRPKGECMIYEILDKCKNPPDHDPMWQNVLISYEVDPETVCQYTGMVDKAGNEIYEGDILKLTQDYGFDYYGNKMSVSICCEVRYEETSFIVRNARYFKTTLGNLKSGEIEVIGNVWDSLELLEAVE